ncbi:unnamed protein product [Choristocarpus tenellus]
MPRLDHRKLEILFSSDTPRPSPSASRRRAITVQMAYVVYALVFISHEIVNGSLVHRKPPAELFKVVVYAVSCLVVFRSIELYLRLMIIWTITTAFTGLFQPFIWLNSGEGTARDRLLVTCLLGLSFCGMIGNVVGALTVLPKSRKRIEKPRRRTMPAKKES